MDVEKLILLIQERPLLWDTRTEEYHDRMCKERAWDEVTRDMLPREWEKGTSSKRRKLVQRLKTRWQSCRDQFRRERVQAMGKSGDGGVRKKPYLYTRQLAFLKPVLDLRPTVDSLEEQRGLESTTSDEERVAAPQDSPSLATEEPLLSQPLDPAEREESSAVEVGAEVHSSPEPLLRRLSRRRRGAPQPAEPALNTRAIVESQVLEYLRQRRIEGKEERMLSGLAPLIEPLSAEKQDIFVSVMATVANILKSPMDPVELVRAVHNVHCRALTISVGTSAQPGPSMYFQQPIQQTYS
ncbi:uncharacterized protein LOC122922103 [Bufo gargarizans]|uniref:uncharacterized protein LOC122922103 n=1 Tax=Bufo gargarizans TaxID=30331 RepID=UPI001CF573F1|nr:uncharacterized protein LOC122922103 [Bufo gargarizans]